ncbi:hypothetical protein ACFL35_14975, partial [Candidatus Riflebacteria bacterium]
MRKKNKGLVYSTDPDEISQNVKDRDTDSKNKERAVRLDKIHYHLEVSKKNRGGKTVTLVKNMRLPAARMKELLS